MSPVAERLGSASRLGTFVVLAAFTLILGVLFRSTLMLSLAEAMIALLVLCWIAGRLTLPGIRVTRQYTERAFEDDEVTVRLRVENRGWLPAYMLEVHDRFTADSIPARSAVVQWLRGANTVRYSGRCSRGRGTWAFGPMEVTISDALGLFRFRRAIPTDERLIVYPRPFPIQRLDIETLMHRVFSGTDEVARPGHSTNFYGLREWRPGEPLRRIHWRASARRDRPLLKEFEAPSHTEVTVFLDLDRRTLRGIGRGSNLEVAVRLTAAFARYAVDHAHPVRLVADGERPVVIGPRTGEAHILAILEALAHVTPRGEAPYLDLLERSTPLLSDGGRAILIFNRPYLDAERFEAIWAVWRRRGIHALAVVIDEQAFLPLDEWNAPSGDRERAEAVMARYGIPFASVPSAEAVEEAVA